MIQDYTCRITHIKNYQVDSNNNNLGESNLIKDKVFKDPLLLGDYVRVAKWK